MKFIEPSSHPQKHVVHYRCQLEWKWGKTSRLACQQMGTVTSFWFFFSAPILHENHMCIIISVSHAYRTGGKQNRCPHSEAFHPLVSCLRAGRDDMNFILDSSWYLYGDGEVMKINLLRLGLWGGGWWKRKLVAKMMGWIFECAGWRPFWVGWKANVRNGKWVNGAKTIFLRKCNIAIVIGRSCAMVVRTSCLK